MSGVRDAAVHVLAWLIFAALVGLCLLWWAAVVAVVNELLVEPLREFVASMAGGGRVQ